MRPLIALAVVFAIAPAAASTIESVSPAQLYTAERVVDGSVVALRTRWTAAGTLETIATIAVETTWRGPATPTVELVVPGGTLGDVRQVVLGAPALSAGERARWFLRDRGDGQLGIYGWTQGVWPARVIGGATIYAPGTIAVQFATNGMVWPAATMPVAYRVNRVGSDDLPRADVVAAVDAAFATWQAVPCSALTFRDAGFTNAGLENDGANTVLFLESGWVYGPEAAAVTSLWVVAGQQTADIALNGQYFTWAIGPSNQLMATTLDLQAVLTHEVGHFAGLGHSLRAFDTMYYTWTPWQGQRTLSIDDKLGVCSIYPRTGDECPPTTCAAAETCAPYALGSLCTGTPDPIGAPCNYDHVECEAFCLFTALDLSTGYCSRYCTANADCPPTYHCGKASEGTEVVGVCFPGAPVEPDPPDPPMTCAADDGCPLGQHCDVARGACTFECRTDADCADALCNDRGTCEPMTLAGGGCASHHGGLGLGVLVFAACARRRKR